MKLIEHLKAIERFVLDHKPPPEIRTHLRLLREHLEADDSLLEGWLQKSLMAFYIAEHDQQGDGSDYKNDSL